MSRDGLTEFLAELRKREVRLSLDGDQLRCQAPRGVMTPDLQIRLKQRKEQLIGFLRSAQSGRVRIPPLVPQARNGRIPLSYPQEGAWFMDQLQPGTTFNIHYPARLVGKLELAVLQASLDDMVARHECLRTTFHTVDGQPYQRVNPPSSVRVSRVDLREVPMESRDSHLTSVMADAVHAPFDLETGPLFRMIVVEFDSEDHVLLLAIHHIVFDGQSAFVFLRELTQLYTSRLAGTPAGLTPPAIQYGDFALWERRVVEGRMFQDELDYWRGQLADRPSGLEIATDKSPSGGQLFRGDAVSVSLDVSLAGRLRSLARSEGVTLFMLHLAVFKILLMRYGGQQEVVVGTAVANRSQPAMHDLIGFCVNLLPLRTDLSGNPSFRELLGRERDVCLSGFSHQDLPFGVVVQELVPDRSVGATPLFQAQFALHEIEDTHAGPASGVSMPLRELFDSPSGMAGFARMLTSGMPAFDYFSLYVLEGSAGLMLTNHYRADLFDPESIRRMLAHHGRLLEGVVADPDAGILDLPMADPQELDLILKDLPGPRAAIAEGLTLDRLFERQADASPASVALVVPPADAGAPEVALTYGELNARANRLARYLSALSTEPEERVGICIDRSAEMVVAVLAAIKAGKTFIPLDHSQGRHRLERIVKEASVGRLLTKRGLVDDEVSSCAPTVELDTSAGEIAMHDPSNLELSIDPAQLAYVVYTSGSTGKPKGVMVTHANVAAMFGAWREDYRLGEIGGHLQMANFAFDVFVGDLARALFSGGRLVLCPRETLLIPEKLAALLREQKVECAEFVPAVIRGLIAILKEQGERLDFMKVLIVGSDRWTAEEYLRLKEVSGEATRVVNSYGVAEMTIDSCYFEDASGTLTADRVLPVGRSFAGTQTYVLDVRLEPVPPGIAGELYIGGANLPRGYVDDPALTAGVYVPHPFAEAEGERLYRTGDRARWRWDGALEILGRVDQQIKVRGYRIEPGEVEAALKDFPSVAHSVVIGELETGSEENYLVAYVSFDSKPPEPDSGERTRALRRHLRGRLPEYMVPSFFVFLEQFPLSPNGKVNRKALPRHDRTSGGQEEFEPARTPVELELVKIWQQVLNVERVGASSDFFALGGHSLKASQIIHRIKQHMKVELPLRTIFEAPTLRALAQAVQEASASPSALPPIHPTPRDQAIPLSYAQEGAWFLDQMQPGVTFNIVIPIALKAVLDLDVLGRVLEKVADRHEALRTSFQSSDGQPFQVIGISVHPPLTVVDLRDQPPPARAGRLIDLVIDEAQRGFDLEKGPLFRAKVFRMLDDEQLVLLTVHHIVFDGHSANLLIRDLAELYAAELTGRSPRLPYLPVQYADYALWQRKVLQGEFLQNQLDYWSKQLDDCPTRLNLSPQLGSNGPELYLGGTVSIQLPDSLVDAVRELSRQEGVTLFVIMIAAYKALLARYSGQQDIVVGTPVANRSQAEMADVIGFCVNMLALRTDLSGNPTFRDLFKRERDVCMDGLSHQELPFGLLVQHMHPDRYLSRSPFFSVGFGMLQGEPGSKGAGVGASTTLGLDTEALTEQVREMAQTTPSSDQLYLQIVDTGTDIYAGLQHSSAAFTPESTAGMLTHFEALLRGACADPTTPLFDVDLLNEDERRRTLIEFNKGWIDVPAGVGLHNLVERHAAARPDAVAVVAPAEPGSDRADAVLTYSELNTRANRLARVLAGRGVGPESRVGVCMDRSTDLLVAVLGILKASAVLVPLDPAQGTARLDFVIEDSGAELVLGHRSLLPDKLGFGFLDWDRCIELMGGEAGSDLHLPVEDRQLAYLIYTSGSTGRPKAVMVTHGALMNAFSAWNLEYGLEGLHCHLQMASFTFDVFMGDVARALGSGARLVLCPRESLLDPPELAGLIERYEVRCAEFVPAVVRPLIEHLAATGGHLDGFELMIVGSDVWYSNECEQVRKLLGPGARLVNSYGVAESTIDSSYYESTPAGEAAAGLVPIGRPFPNTQMFVLDPYLNPVPTGAAGELYLAGPGLARGYSGRPELTAERFVPNPFGSGDRLYRTGDRVRHLSDGNIAFIGRADNQIKIRGFRIEPGEIEAVLGEIEGVKQAVVLGRGDGAIERHLVAYVCHEPGVELAQADLRRILESRLPAYMVPSAFVVLDNLPLSSSGKVDRKALPDPAGPGIERSTEYVEPATPTEQMLAGIWSSVLQVERVGAADNFFALGGHSLLAARTVARARDVFEVRLPLRALFEHPTVAGLARTIDLALVQGIGPDDEVDLDREAVLAEDIVPRGEPETATADARNILLTGANGFLGAYLLRELLDRTQAEIFCLVRAGSPEHAAERLRDGVAQHGQWDEASAGRVHAVAGDLATPRLGLSDSDYEMLAQRIDAIFHNGAWVSAVYPYSLLKGSNVTGTEEILRLACEHKTKAVHCVSTLSVFAPPLWTGGDLEETFPVDSWKGLTGGYPQTKWVAEKLIDIARQRGIPVTVFRPGFIAGDSTSGFAKDLEGSENLGMLLEMGVVPHLEGLSLLQVVPVDFVARSIVYVAMQPESIGRAFHLFNHRPADMSDVTAALRRAGYRMEELDPRQWAVLALEQLRQNPSPVVQEALPLIPAEVNDLIAGWARELAGSGPDALPRIDWESNRPEVPASVVHTENTDAVLEGSGIECTPAADLLGVYLEHLIKAGKLRPPEASRAI